MASTEAIALATRLRQLRDESFPDRRVTQKEVAKALGVTPPLISSWENQTQPVPPPSERLDGYALFFSTPRSLDGGKSRLLDVDELTSDERRRHDELADELHRLHAATSHTHASSPATGRTGPPSDGPWHFADGATITIMCAQLPAELRADESYASPYSPDYVELYSYADLDSLFELHGHVRAANPESQVNFILAANATRDQLTTHMVILGGVDWNPIARKALEVLTVPVTQSHRGDDDPGDPGFAVVDGDQRSVFRPVLGVDDEGHRILVEDVAHFYRGPNPFNQKRTVTICNAMFGRGVYGIVRTLTDARFRDRNAQYIRDRFSSDEAFSILSRVLVVEGEVITPDWTNAGTVLHEWPRRSR